jgi:hypothetical protein
MLPLPPGSARWCVEAVSFCSLMAHREGDARKTLEELRQRAQQTCVQRAAALAGGHSCSFGRKEPERKKPGRKGPGEKDQALDRLQMAFDDRSAGLVYLKVDPAFDAPRGDSRFAGLLHRIRFFEGPSDLDGRSKGTPVLPLAFLDLVRFLRMQSGAGRVSIL